MEKEPYRHFSARVFLGTSTLLLMRSLYSPFEILHISTSFIFLFIKIFHITAMPLVSYLCLESFIFLRYSPVFKILERGESHYSIVCEEYSRNVVRREGAPFILEFMHFSVQHLWSCHSWNGMQSAKLKLKGSIISKENAENDKSSKYPRSELHVLFFTACKGQGILSPVVLVSSWEMVWKVLKVEDLQPSSALLFREFCFSHNFE